MKASHPKNNPLPLKETVSLFQLFALGEQISGVRLFIILQWCFLLHIGINLDGISINCYGLFVTVK